jgi:hypothetical protein
VLVFSTAWQRNRYRLCASEMVNGSTICSRTPNFEISALYTIRFVGKRFSFLGPNAYALAAAQ